MPKKRDRDDLKKKKDAEAKPIRILLPKETFEIYEDVADREHISVTQVVARVAIEFAEIEKRASLSRSSLLDRSRGELLKRMRREQRGGRADAPPSEAVADPVADLYADIFSQLFDLDPDRTAAFLHNPNEQAQMVSERGMVSVDYRKDNSRVYECFAQDNAKASFRSGEWPIEAECHGGGVSLLFTGKQFRNLPVLVEFGSGQLFGLPPEADCTIQLKRGTTVVFRSQEPREGESEATIDFDKIAMLVSDLAERDALEPLPGSEKKGLIIKL